MTLNKCRLCLDSEELTNNIFDKEDEVMISTKIMSLAKVDIYPNDGLPNKVCHKCLTKLNSCLLFIQQCENVDSKLRAVINKNVYPDYNEAKLIITPFEFDDKKELQDDNSENTLGEEVCTEDAPLTESIQIKEENDRTNIEKNRKKAQKEQCFTCGKVLSSKYTLKMHLRIHTGEKPYSCSDCGKSFTRPENLKVHLRIHTGEKPLECTVCGVQFAHSSGLLAHKRKHTGQLPYICTLCPRSFRTLGHLRYHVRRHTGETSYECDTCSRGFITRAELKQHVAIHTGDKPHVCSVCGVRFGRQSNLKRHVKHQHNGQKPYCCNKCSHKFAQRSDFQRHKKKHEKQELNK